MGEVVAWRDVHTGDRVTLEAQHERAPAGVWLVWRRDDQVALTQPGHEPLFGQPDPDSRIIRLYRGELTLCIDVMNAAGLGVEVISEGAA